MPEGPDAVRLDDVEDRLEDVELLLDDDLGIRVRCRGERRRRDGRSDRLARLRKSGRVSQRAERGGAEPTLTTQMGFERIAVAAPAPNGKKTP